MSEASTRAPFWQGFRDGAPFILVIVPFGILFGVLASEAGLNLFETLSFSVLVLAGAAQFTALQLINDHVPTLIIVTSALAVNLRLAMYSASLTPHFGGASMPMRALLAYLTIDQNYSTSIIAFEDNPTWGLPEKTAYFMGSTLSVSPAWIIFTAAGALLGTGIPPEFALDFAVPITFLAMIAPMLKTPAHRAAALSAVVASLSFAFLPYSLGVLVGGSVGMIVGARVELWQEKRAQGTS
ncbi:MAG: AzlC family ABC transporter permease [Thalassovita sp.]